MERKAVLVGDPPSSGGAVMPGAFTQATVKGVPYATIGGAVHCVACKSIGTIAKAGGPYRLPMYGFEMALENDIVLCKCQVPPKLVAKTISSGTPKVTVDDRMESLGVVPSPVAGAAGVADDTALYPLVGRSFATALTKHDQQFMLLDANSRPLSAAFYSVRLPTGKVVHGVANGRGLTDRYETDGTANLQVYIGHVGFKLPVPLYQGTTNTDPNSLVVVQSERLGKPWIVSDDGIEFIAVLESGVSNGKNWVGQSVVSGMILKVYDDGYGIPTVGLGHKVVPADRLKMDDEITIDQARAFARTDIADVERFINQLVRVPLNQYEYDALVSVLFNTGPYRGKHDSSNETRAERVAKMVNGGDFKAAAEWLEKFIADRVPGRRKNEAKLFKTGTYDASH
ncbi:hypothetical protein DIC66_16185 [Rhodoferax lacus]|uniref:Lysozyme n=1 Tax=Rhodoferax lacus TaxID=2184758 RepID=A0A3E1R9N1_9BURK|nr:PAAR domain-containing protein [Rhodoferax lacus]RFO95963.1 hypothetical protein DIC66_16185 [Rhodoferax lacus]